MCLYERKILNPKYQPNKKNKGIIPNCTDKRLLHIKIKCGKCLECKRENARNWRTRLLEEFKSNNKGAFVTLSFSPEWIDQLEREIHNKKYLGWQGDTTDVNILASYAIRMFTERWRKKYKKAPRHFFTTEIGHNGSERLHIHGIIWKTEDTDRNTWENDIDEKWKYGNTFIGDTFTERTINYVIKYITKLDNTNEDYQQRTFVSKGLGADYIKRNGWEHTFRGEKTKQTYKTYKGYDINLPRYYKLKLWTDEEREQLRLINEAEEKGYIKGVEYDLTRQDEEEFRKTYLNALRTARADNKLLGYGDNKETAYRYIITDLMKMKTEKIKNYNKTKLVKKVQKREIDNIRKVYTDTDTTDLGKHIEVEEQKQGLYIGSTSTADRNRNQEIIEAKQAGITVRELRLIKAGIITNIVYA